ncbi:hypothetical protein ET33_22000 [Paenibacillus tyrfis]|uniref:Uncharacterized protein n=1 Tax=Paenibacillus tyrfis TaxID=1501230 RepID=A0A081NVW3_9BACL|nr:hypothetical protein ET33_22000 [Paenibacillus tyrfis]
MNYKSFFYIFLLSVIVLFLMMSSKIINGIVMILYFGLLFLFSKVIRNKFSSTMIIILNLVVVFCILYFKIP